MESIQYVFLDRDGVLNRKMPEGSYVTRWEDFEWLPGAQEAVARMKRAGVTVILVTNQRAIALGLLETAGLESIHAKMMEDLERNGARLDAIYYCPHDRAECSCRKPEIGLFLQSFHDFPNANRENSVVIGDSLSDIQAGKRLGMKTVFILGEAERQKPGAAEAANSADVIAASLLNAVESYLCLQNKAKTPL